MRTIVFNEDARDFVLSVFGKKVGNDGYIIEDISGSRVITPDDNFIKGDDLAAVVPGSEVFVTNDMPSLLKYANKEMAGGKTA